jgi:hypothetical protein
MRTRHKYFKTAWRDLYRQAAAMKAKTYYTGTDSIQIEAPRFHRWKLDQIHELVCTDVTDALDRIGQGVEKCPVQDCDWCNDSLKEVFGIRE